MPLSEKAEDEDLWDDDWNIIDRTVEQLRELGGEDFRGEGRPNCFLSRRNGLLTRNEETKSDFNSFVVFCEVLIGLFVGKYMPQTYSQNSYHTQSKTKDLPVLQLRFP